MTASEAFQQWAVLCQDAGDAEPAVFKCIGGKDEAVERATAIQAGADPPYDRVWVAARQVTYGPWLEDRCTCKDPRNAPELDCSAHFFRARDRARRAGRRAVDRHGGALAKLSDLSPEDGKNDKTR